jgi:hypothetical protein
VGSASSASASRPVRRWWGASPDLTVCRTKSVVSIVYMLISVEWSMLTDFLCMFRFWFPCLATATHVISLISQLLPGLLFLHISSPFVYGSNCSVSWFVELESKFRHWTSNGK